MFPSEVMCNMCVYGKVDERERERERMNEGKWMMRKGEGGRGEKNSELNQVQGHLYQNKPRANKLNRQAMTNSKVSNKVSM